VTANFGPLLLHLRTLSAARPDCDATRLDRFTRFGDQRAFAALVAGHGPMVLRVCRRVLGDAQAAEDATQATFLVLARKARTLGPADALAGWLHGVACRVALKARAGLARRGQPLQAADPPADKHPDPLAELSVRELLAIIDEEVVRLPKEYRLPVFLCCLEGHSQEEAARRLGWTPGSVKGRLERGRKLLQARLVRRGIVPAAALVALEVCRAPSAAAMPAALASATVSAAVAFTGTQESVAAAPPAAARLAGEVLGGAGTVKLRPALVALLVLGLTALGASPFVQWSPTAPPATPEPSAQPAAPQTDGKGHVDREGIALPPEAVARIGSTRLRHPGRMSAVAYAPDGKSIASLDEDGHLCFWDASTGQLQRRFRPTRGAYDGRLVFRPDGRSMVIFDGNVCRSIDVATGKELRSFRQDSRRGFALYPSFDPAGMLLAIHENAFLRLVEVNTGKERFETGLEGLIADAAVSGDGTTVAAAVANGGTVVLLDATTGKPRRRLEGPDGSAGRLAFAPDGKYLFSCGSLPVLWDLAAGKVVGRIPGYYNGLCAAFSPDYRRVAAGGHDGVVIAEVPGGKEVHRLPAYGATCLAFAADGRTLLVGGWNGDVSQWDVSTGRLLAASASPFPEVERLSFLDEHRLLVQAQTFESWDWRTCKVLQRFPEFDAGPYGSPDVSADGRWLAYPVGKGEIALIDTRGVEKPRRLPGHKHRCLALRFSPDGRTLFSTGWDNAVRGWDVATGQLRHEWKDHADTPTNLLVSPDGRRVLAATTGLSALPRQTRGLHVWDVKTDRLAHTLSVPDRYFLTFAFSPDGRLLAAAGGEGEFDLNTPGHIVLFDLASGKAVRDIVGHPRPVYAIAFSPDGRCLVAADREWKKEIAFRYWELATGRERHRFDGHTGHVHALAFSPSGALLAAASPEAPAYVWDVYGRSLPAPPIAARSAAGEQRRLWEDLGSADANVAFQALRRSIGHPEAAVVLFGEHLRPAAPVDLKPVKQWLQDLDSDDYKVRKAAAEELENLGDHIEPVLREAVAAPGLGLEPKRRVQALIERLEAPTPDRLARLHALEALEQIASPAAARLLERLAAGAPGAPLTREAAASLDRLRKR
jgi:RNA polymerase sigma factor (sigma-70 family)